METHANHAKFFNHLDLRTHTNTPTTTKFHIVIFFESNKNENKKKHTVPSFFVVGLVVVHKINKLERSNNAST